MLRDQIKNLEVVSKKKIQPIKEKIEIYSNLNVPFPYISSKVTEENKLNEVLEEELNLVHSIWDDLGVTEEYRKVFESIVKELDEQTRKELFEFEITSLKKFSNSLYKLSKDINSRDKNVSQLRILGESLSDNKEKLSEKVLSEITQCIRNLRIQTINIVYHFNKIREISSYNLMAGKFNLEKLNKTYVYDKNYLIKMRYDLDFLKSSSLSEYFEFSDQSDPFFTRVSDNSTNPNKHHVSISPEMLNSIRECELHMINDVIFFQMQAKRMARNSKSPKFKIKYPLAQPVVLNKAKYNSSKTQTKHRPFSSSNDFNKIYEKSTDKYYKLFLTSKNENFMKTYQDRKINIDCKAKIEIADSKSQENKITSKILSSNERARSVTKNNKRKESKPKKMDYFNNVSANYNTNFSLHEQKKEISPKDKKIKIHIKENHSNKDNQTESIKNSKNQFKDDENFNKSNNNTNYNSGNNKVLPVNKESEIYNTNQINYDFENLEKASNNIKDSNYSQKSIKNFYFPDSRDERISQSKINNEKFEDFEDVIKEEADDKIEDEIFKYSKNGESISNQKNLKKNGFSYQQNSETEKGEIDILVEENGQEKNKKESFVDKSHSCKSKEIHDNKDNLISMISNKISEDDRDLEDEINYDLLIEEEIKEEKTKKVNNNILDDLKYEENHKDNYEEKIQAEKELESKMNTREVNQDYQIENDLNELNLQNKAIKIHKDHITENEKQSKQEPHSTSLIAKEKIIQDNSHAEVIINNSKINPVEKEPLSIGDDKKEERFISIIKDNQPEIHQENQFEIKEEKFIPDHFENKVEEERDLSVIDEIKNIQEEFNVIENKENQGYTQINDRIGNTTESVAKKIENDNSFSDCAHKNQDLPVFENNLQTDKSYERQLDQKIVEEKKIQELKDFKNDEYNKSPSKENEKENKNTDVMIDKIPPYKIVTINKDQEENKINNLEENPIENDKKNSKNSVELKEEILINSETPNNKVEGLIEKEKQDIFEESKKKITNVSVTINDKASEQDQQLSNYRENNTNLEPNIVYNVNLNLKEETPKNLNKDIFESFNIPKASIEEHRHDNRQIEVINPVNIHNQEELNDIKIQKIENKNLSFDKKEKIKETTEEKIHKIKNHEKSLHKIDSIEKVENEIMETIEEKKLKEIIEKNEEKLVVLKKEDLEEGFHNEIHEEVILDEIHEKIIEKVIQVEVDEENIEKVGLLNVQEERKEMLNPIESNSKSNDLDGPIPSPYIITYFSGDLENLNYIYPIYLLKVRDDLKASFKIENELNSYLTGFYPKILLAHKNNMMAGFCCVNYDASDDLNLRLNINHISTNLHDEFEPIANEFIKFIIQNIPCDEIRIGIYYELKNGNLEINPFIRDVFKNTLKFRWFKLENKSNNERIQILNYKCENKDLSNELRNKKTNSLKLDYFSVLKVEEIKDNKEITIEEISNNENKTIDEQKVNFCSLMFCLIELTKQNYELDNENFKKISSGQIEVILTIDFLIF